MENVSNVNNLLYTIKNTRNHRVTVPRAISIKAEVISQKAENKLKP